MSEKYVTREEFNEIIIGFQRALESATMMSSIASMTSNILLSECKDVEKAIARLEKEFESYDKHILYSQASEEYIQTWRKYREDYLKSVRQAAR